MVARSKALRFSGRLTPIIRTWPSRSTVTRSLNGGLPSCPRAGSQRTLGAGQHLVVEAQVGVGHGRGREAALGGAPAGQQPPRKPRIGLRADRGVELKTVYCRRS